MNALFSFANRSVRILALIAAIGTILMMAHICLDVVLRNVFRISLVTAPEVIARYYMVLVAFLPLAWLERRDGMVSVELLEWVLGARARQASDIAVALLSSAAYGVLAWTTYGSAMRHYNIGTFVEFSDFDMPVWHSYFLPPTGFFLAMLICLIKTVEYAANKPHEPNSEPFA
ncbi:MAG: TRAP transporter small permease [Rhodobacteraceae bacterium]|nr:TRAP transporter small permease [Paracoccaceae bacterium]